MLYRNKTYTFAFLVKESKLAKVYVSLRPKCKTRQLVNFGKMHILFDNHLLIDVLSGKEKINLEIMHTLNNPRMCFITLLFCLRC